MLYFLRGFSGTEFLVISISYILVMVVAFTLHEFAHAFVAVKQGDDTPKAYRRLSINPINHIDPIGFLCCALFGFGWAKPVEVNPLKFRKYRKGMALVSVAGVFVNLILAIINCGLWVIFVKYVSIDSYILEFLYYLFQFGFTINMCLFVFNLLPVYPLDGFNLINALTKNNNPVVNFLRNYGYLFLFIFVFVFDNALLWLIDIISSPILMFWELIF